MWLLYIMHLINAFWSDHVMIPDQTNNKRKSINRNYYLSIFLYTIHHEEESGKNSLTEIQSSYGQLMTSSLSPPQINEYYCRRCDCSGHKTRWICIINGSSLRPLTLSHFAIATHVHIVVGLGNVGWAMRLISSIPTVPIVVAQCSMGNALLLIRTLELGNVTKEVLRGQGLHNGVFLTLFLWLLFRFVIILIIKSVESFSYRVQVLCV